jgi:hypothetical protein
MISDKQTTVSVTNITIPVTSTSKRSLSSVKKTAFCQICYIVSTTKVSFLKLVDSFYDKSIGFLTNLKFLNSTEV